MPRNWSWGHKRKSGYRSGLEEKIAQTLTEKGIKFDYESLVLSYNKKVVRGQCRDCNGTRVVSVKTYRPDFVLDNGKVIEVKGRLTATDRSKLIAVRESNPDTLLVLFFASDNKLSKNSELRYSDWATKHKFDFAIGTIPRRWLTKRKGEEV